MNGNRCPHCGLVNFAGALKCKRCDGALDVETFTPTNRVTPPSTEPRVSFAHGYAAPAFSRAQGNLLIGLAGIVFLLLAWTIFKPSAVPKFEYVTLDQRPIAPSRVGAGALEPTAIDIDEAKLAQMGAAGWELVGTILENETVYPNFGDSQYVTGLQPNMRPQRALLLFKRQLK
jgi:hypothetical protein